MLILKFFVLLFLPQVMSTGQLSAVRLVFPGTELESGVTHLEYLRYISTARPRQDLSKQLIQDITTIENTLACRLLETFLF